MVVCDEDLRVPVGLSLHCAIQNVPLLVHVIMGYKSEARETGSSVTVVKPRLDRHIFYGKSSKPLLSTREELQSGLSFFCLDRVYLSTYRMRW